MCKIRGVYMYFNSKEDTNIDKELKKTKRVKTKKKENKNLFKIIGIIIGALLLIAIIVLIIAFGGKYRLVLYGSRKITIYEGTTYNEPGYEAYDRQKNNLNEEVVVNSNLDSSKIGTYTITYSLYNKTKKRTIKVVARPEVITIIHLNGDKNMYLNVGSQYVEPGYSAIDSIDGDLTKKVTTSGSVNTARSGTYRIVYSVVNSSGVTTAETRTIIVQ